MYATAQRVAAPSGDRAVHAFLHQHGEGTWADDVADWPESNPGQLVAQRTVLPLGGNRVESYLDLLAPDGTSSAVLDEALAAFLRDLPERANPTIMVVGAITIRFGTDLGLEARRPEAFSELAHAVRELRQPGTQ